TPRTTPAPPTAKATVEMVPNVLAVDAAGFSLAGQWPPGQFALIALARLSVSTPVPAPTPIPIAPTANEITAGASDPRFGGGGGRGGSDTFAGAAVRSSSMASRAPSLIVTVFVAEGPSLGITSNRWVPGLIATG